MKSFIITFIICALTIGISPSVKAQHGVQVREETRSMPTYGFSDPDPVANIGNIYPYFRFDHYSAQAEDKEWNFIEIENDYIKVFITPEIGGKIWGAIEKSTGKEFIYFNHAIKFRDVAMRGPWTSGGIESNFGLIGHAPTTSTPVDYLIRKNDDGSVSCFIGAIDLPSRTEWRVEINLQPDKSWFTTRAFWYNPTSMEQSYYQWMNAGVKAAGNLEFSYPGTNYIGHDGSLHSWPTHPEGMDISWYEKNNFGGYKSYHILGELTNFFGGYWHDDEFGFGHYADYSAKPGKKLWIWGLSPQGMVWEDLLTDTDGQYVEIQSGRLFNQEGANSILSPFKHRSFTPGAADVWTEYWFPVMSTKGVLQASPKASVNLSVKDGLLNIWLSANEIITDSVWLEVDNKIIAGFPLNMKPTEVVHHKIVFTGSKNKLAVKIGSDYLIPPGGMAAQKLSRPLSSVDFDWQSVQGLSIKAQSLEQERNYNEALNTYLSCLVKDPNYLPALVGAARLYYRQTNLPEGLKLVRRAMAIDTYYPSANYLYGVLNEAMGNVADAMDGYAIAAAAMEYKSPAFLALAKVYFKRQQFSKAIDYTNKSIDFNAHNLAAYELQLLAYRKSGQLAAFKTSLHNIQQDDPLNHFAGFEKFLVSQDPDDLARFNDLITNELPHETYLELAIKYYNLGLVDEAVEVLKHSPRQAMVLYWLSYLTQETNPAESEKYLLQANSSEPTLVFPFRQESITVLAWATRASASWKPKYYLALIWWNLGLQDQAKQELLEIDDKPNFFPFYLAKAELFSGSDGIKEQSLVKAYQLAPKNWRTTLALSQHYVQTGQLKKALSISKKNFKLDPKNYYIGLHYAKILLLADENSACLKILQELKVLPNEGATEGHHLHRVAGLNLAAEALAAKKYDNAISYLDVARSWPENLGVGKPYITDERIENYLQGLILMETGKKKKAEQLFDGIVDNYAGNKNQSIAVEDILVLATYQQLGKKTKAEEQVKDWQKTDPNNLFEKWATAWLGNNSDALKQTTENIDKSLPNPKIGSKEYYLRWVIKFLNENPIK